MWFGVTKIFDLLVDTCTDRSLKIEGMQVVIKKSWQSQTLLRLSSQAFQSCENQIKIKSAEN